MKPTDALGSLRPRYNWLGHSTTSCRLAVQSCVPSLPIPNVALRKLHIALAMKQSCFFPVFSNNEGERGTTVPTEVSGTAGILMKLEKVSPLETLTLLSCSPNFSRVAITQ